jgi:hypothetical protein
VSIYNEEKIQIFTFSSIDGNEINQLQERLASTEAQMCKILTALDMASNKVNQITTKSQKVQIKSLIMLFIFCVLNFRRKRNINRHLMKTKVYHLPMKKMKLNIVVQNPSVVAIYQSKKINRHQLMNKIEKINKQFFFSNFNVCLVIV